MDYGDFGFWILVIVWVIVIIGVVLEQNRRIKKSEGTNFGKVGQDILNQIDEKEEGDLTKGVCFLCRKDPRECICKEEEGE